MCGIAGVVYRDQGVQVSTGDLRRMCDTLVHRGPDDEGFFVDGGVGLGMRRLSIIDLAGGHQPMCNEDGRIWIIFNGEIYNFPDLRKELERLGHRFATHSDTEAIVHAYEEYGDDCVSKLNGMFAFAIWDQRLRRLFLARDRLGVKPLYYYLDGDFLAFGSEIKAILQLEEVPRELDLQALDAYLTFEYIPAPLSIFRGIRKLPPGHTLAFQEGRALVRQYWEVPCGAPLAGGEEELRQRLYELLRDAVRIRLISDVPLGAFLSGGIDSSTIVCLMSEVMDRPVKTFSIGFDDPSYNELGYARAVARHFGTDHEELTIRPDVAGLTQDLVRYLDEPLADVSIFPTYLVSRLARQQVTVALSGDGGDELFAGYDWYLADRLERAYRHLPASLRQRLVPYLLSHVPPSSQKKGLVNVLKRFVEGAALPAELEHYRWNTFLTPEARRQMYTGELLAGLDGWSAASRFVACLNAFGNADPLWRQQTADIKTYLADDILMKVDRMSMANSLEARTPFLDYRVVELAASLPSQFKLRGLKRKYLLKRCMAGRLPPLVLSRGKQGFSIPMKNWLRGELRPLLLDVLSPARLRREGLFNPPCVEELVRQHLEGVANHSHQLWALMVFEVWREIYLR